MIAGGNLLLFVSEISLVNVTEQYALAQAAATRPLPSQRGDTSFSVAAVLTFRVGPADQPDVSALPFDALLSSPLDLTVS